MCVCVHIYWDVHLSLLKELEASIKDEAMIQNESFQLVLNDIPYIKVKYMVSLFALSNHLFWKKSLITCHDDWQRRVDEGVFGLTTLP